LKTVNECAYKGARLATNYLYLMVCMPAKFFQMYTLFLYAVCILMYVYIYAKLYDTGLNCFISINTAIMLLYQLA